MPNLKTVLGLMFSKPIVFQAIKVALVVGSILNLINQGQNLNNDQPLILWQLLMNYCVPFLVSSYSAAKNQTQRDAQNE